MQNQPQQLCNQEFEKISEQMLLGVGYPKLGKKDRKTEL